MDVPTPPTPDPLEATQLLERLADGDAGAAEDLLPLVYRELRARAGSYFRGQRADPTLQPTALVHEAYLRLVRAPDAEWRGRAHFCAVAATAMRRILINHARTKRAANRAVAGRRENATAISTPSHGSAIDLLALDDALAKLTKLDPRMTRLVELRFFGGLSVEEVAGVLEVSTSTVQKEWRRTRAWLIDELGEGVS